MKCPKCGNKTEVEQTRYETARRRRGCLTCHYQFHTLEIEVDPLPQGPKKGYVRTRKPKPESA